MRVHQVSRQYNLLWWGMREGNNKGSKTWYFPPLTSVQSQGDGPIVVVLCTAA